MISEFGLLLLRIVSVLPEFLALWDAAKTNDPQQELDASLSLIRAVKDRQAREVIEGQLFALDAPRLDSEPPPEAA